MADIPPRPPGRPRRVVRSIPVTIGAVGVTLGPGTLYAALARLEERGLWGSRTSAVLSSSSVVVFVDQTAEDLSSAHHAAGGTQLNRATLSWRSLFERAMRPVRVVVGRVLGQHVHELPLVEDQHPVQAFAADGAHPPLGVGVGLRRTRRTTQYRDADVGEHGIEAGRELRVAIADQEPESVSLLPQREREVASPAQPLAATRRVRSTRRAV